MASSLIVVLAVVALVVGWGVFFGGRLPALYGARSCQGASWRRRFPESSKHDIREFLSLFVSAFAFNEDQKLKLSPDDGIFGIYRALYPSRMIPDAMEVETLARDIERKYGTAFAAVWQDELTLGQLYSYVNAHRIERTFGAATHSSPVTKQCHFMHKHIILFAIFAFTPFGFSVAEPAPAFVEHISALANGRRGTPMQLKKDEIITTKATFRPPVEILIEAKTNSTNLRLGYAADQIIFNWEMATNELRIDGGPANGQHRKTGGLIPINKYVVVRWVVTPTKQSIYVDEQLRFEHTGDYSGINNPVSVSSSHGSMVAVKSIKVKQLAPATE